MLKCLDVPQLPNYSYSVYNEKLRKTSDYDKMKSFLPIEVKEAVDERIELSEKLTLRSKTYIVESINTKTTAKYGKILKLEMMFIGR